MTFEEAYNNTMDRQRWLESEGYSVRVMWECELSKLLREDPMMAFFFESYEIPLPLEPRDSFNGGLCCC